MQTPTTELIRIVEPEALLNITPNWPGHLALAVMWRDETALSIIPFRKDEAGDALELITHNGEIPIWPATWDAPTIPSVAPGDDGTELLQQLRKSHLRSIEALSAQMGRGEIITLGKSLGETSNIQSLPPGFSRFVHSERQARHKMTETSLIIRRSKKKSLELFVGDHIRSRITPGQNGSLIAGANSIGSILCIAPEDPHQNKPGWRLETLRRSEFGTFYTLPPDEGLKRLTKHLKKRQACHWWMCPASGLIYVDISGDKRSEGILPTFLTLVGVGGTITAAALMWLLLF